MFTGTALTVAIALGRGWQPRMPAWSLPGPPARRGHPQAGEAEVTGGGTRSSSMWVEYASETTVYRN